MLTSQLLPLLVQLLLLSGWARTQDNRPPTYGVIPEVPESIRKNPENSQEQKPKIIMYWQLENRSVQAGKKTVFLCDITGLPVPEYTWIKDGRIIDKSDLRLRTEATNYGAV
uniref:Ig-like domain-containing protein n=1 Tax=Macrostomum lignano TaxID=282301 RepID=A0A1I8IXQ4_9PLAT